MPTSYVIGLVVLGVVVAVLVLSAVAKLTLHLMKRPLEGRIAARYSRGDVLFQDLTANSFGLESAGVWQGRGNGALVLTATHLHFFQLMSRPDLLIPLDAIVEITFPKSLMGKATVYDLLKVRFVVDGKTDSSAWYVADPRAWKERIEAARASTAAH